MQRGFTLIEVIIYIALFSLLMGTAFVTTFQLIQSSGNLSTKNTTQEEGSFVLRKIDWALTGAKSVTATSTLTVTKYDDSQVVFCLDSEKIKIWKGTGNVPSCNNSSFIPLTTDNVKVSNFTLTTISGTPAGITATLKITKDGVDFPFTITKYIRK